MTDVHYLLMNVDLLMILEENKPAVVSEHREEEEVHKSDEYTPPTVCNTYLRDMGGECLFFLCLLHTITV